MPSSVKATVCQWAPWVSKERTPMSYKTYGDLRRCFQSFVCAAFKVLGGQKPKNKKVVKI